MGNLVFIIGLLLAGGAICGYIALMRIAALHRDVHRLERMLRPAVEVRSIRKKEPAPPRATDEPAKSTLFQDSPNEAPQKAAEFSSAAEKHRQSSDRPQQPKQDSLQKQLLNNLQKNWMIWLGASCVALAGIFLVRYSIDQGLLGPQARITMAMGFGMSFHAVAEWFRRRSGEVSPALGALAGAGSITLYAALLTAFRLYDLVSPGITFASMAVVALATMVMAKLHGPMLAAFGILGAFLVPLLVSTGGGDIRVLLTYSIIVAASALMLMRYVYRPWLWWGFAAGALAWGLVAMGGRASGPPVTLYFTALAYLVAALPTFDWKLQRETVVPDLSYKPRDLLRLPEAQDRHRVVFFALLSAGIFLAVTSNPDTQAPWLIGFPFVLFSLLLARRQDQLYWLPWTSLIVSLLAWLLSRLSPASAQGALQLLDPPEQPVFLGFLALQAGITALLSLWILATTKRPAIYASMATLSPILSLALAYLLTTRPEVNWNWGLFTIILALAYLSIATIALRKLSIDSLTVWLFIAGHFALALAAAMAFREASLTLAIAAQLVSLAWVIDRFKLPDLSWLLKTVVAIVVARLTLNPWLPDYPADVHWSLWTYGGSTAFAAVGAYMLRSRETLCTWLGAAALHLLVLTFWAELRYQLYGGAIYQLRSSFLEATIFMLFLGSTALIYHYRAGFSETLRSFVRIYAGALLTISLLSYALIVTRTLSSDAWIYTAVSVTPLWNLATFAFLGPAFLGVCYALLYTEKHRRYAWAFAGVAALICVSMQIRHLWTGTVRLDSPMVSEGELYTYSAVWLGMAMAAVLSGSWRLGPGVYRAGMGLLAIVIAKLFFIDMAGLEGLFRVASFMGLGLCLLGLSFLHQRLASTESYLKDPVVSDSPPSN